MHSVAARNCALRYQPCTGKLALPKALPLDKPIDEEQIPGYQRRNFFHPNPGDKIGDAYVLKAKVGWGSSSTVWLAQKDRTWFWQKKYFAIKITTNNYCDGEAAKELAMSAHLASGNKRHRGHHLLITAVDHFTIPSPNGQHVCLVFEPMREPLWLFKSRLSAGKITSSTLPLFKLYIRGMLYALDYLHTDRHKCFLQGRAADHHHLDLKLDNILMAFEHNSVLERFVESQSANPMPRKVIGEDAIYLCHNDFGDLQEEHLQNVVPKIADFGLAQRGDGGEPLLHPIQPNHCHAPEVLLGTSWSYSADIWNFGVILWDLLGGRELFLGRPENVPDRNEYSAAHHLAEMIALIGPVPRRLIQRQRDMRH
ncbi:Serine/threonine-protein kinase SRPK [Metarhizium anisopliae]